MSAPEAVERQLKKGDLATPIEVDATNIAKAVVRYWGVHAKDVLRRAADIAEESEK
jgi:hypothetical protein